MVYKLGVPCFLFYVNGAMCIVERWNREMSKGIKTEDNEAGWGQVGPRRTLTLLASPGLYPRSYRESSSQMSCF